MKNVCKICSHVDRAAIEAGIAAGTNYEKLSQTFGLSPSGLTRHRKHMPEPSICSQSDQNLLPACDSVIDELRGLQRRARRKADKNPIVGGEMVLKISRELRSWFALRSQLARRIPAVPIDEAEALDADQLAAMTEALAQRKGKLN
jgi:hypothetical protein